MLLLLAVAAIDVALFAFNLSYLDFFIRALSFFASLIAATYTFCGDGSGVKLWFLLELDDLSLRPHILFVVGCLAALQLARHNDRRRKRSFRCFRNRWSR